MNKIMIWVGQFESEADFEKYMDQSDFYNGGRNMTRTTKKCAVYSARNSA